MVIQYYKPGGIASILTGIKNFGKGVKNLSADAKAAKGLEAARASLRTQRADARALSKTISGLQDELKNQRYYTTYENYVRAGISPKRIPKAFKDVLLESQNNETALAALNNDIAATKEAMKSQTAAARRLAATKKQLKTLGRNALGLGVAGGIGYMLGGLGDSPEEVAPEEVAPEEIRLMLNEPNAVYLRPNMISNSQGIVIDPRTNQQLKYDYDPQYKSYYDALASKYGISDVLALQKQLGVKEDGLFGPNTELAYLRSIAAHKNGGVLTNWINVQ